MPKPVKPSRDKTYTEKTALYNVRHGIAPQWLKRTADRLYKTGYTKCEGLDGVLKACDNRRWFDHIGTGKSHLVSGDVFFVEPYVTVLDSDVLLGLENFCRMVGAGYRFVLPAIHHEGCIQIQIIKD